MMKLTRYYDWQQVFSRQTGTNGEFVIVAGAKNIGKTFGLRLELVRRWIKTGHRYVEFCRSKDERDQMQQGYFDKLQNDGFFKEYRFKSTQNIGYLCEIAYDDDGNEVLDDWKPFVYFVSLSTFQQEKKRTFSNVRNFMFDEAIIDRKDKYHRYLPNEFSILANLIDTILREKYDDPLHAHCYLLGNSCDLLCPYLQMLGVRTIPKFGFSWHNDKQTLLHYVEPWDVEQRKNNTLVGRMLANSTEAEMVFENKFSSDATMFIEKKSSAAKYQYGIVYLDGTFSIWLDRKIALIYVQEKLPKNASNVYALTKRDSTIDYAMVRRTDDLMKMMLNAFYAGLVRYDTPSTRERYLDMLSYFGVY